MTEILIAEDTKSVREGVKALLESDFHFVRAAGNGADALALYRRFHPALVILDVMMPKMDGFDVLRQIRANDSETPVLLLTAKTLEEEKVAGFGLGCDDYLTKPFGSRELLARVSALLRRAARPSAANETPDDAAFDFCGGTVVPLDRTFITDRNKPVHLSANEIRLARLLAQHPGETVRKEKLLSCIWAGQHVFTRTVDTHVANIRRKVGRFGCTIQNVYGIGYKYQPPR